MKKILLALIVITLCLPLIGCNEQLTAGGVGIGLGSALQGTISGAKHDLKMREEALIKAYNEGVEIGMEQKELDQIAKELEYTRLMQKGVEAGETFLGVDWSNPKQTGMAFGSLVELGLIIFGGKKLLKVIKENTGLKAGINKFKGTHEPKIAGELHDTIKSKVV